MNERSKPNEIHIVRVYDAAVADVWEAWTDPAQVAQWWGPRGFTLTTHHKELRPGGIWHYTMHGPDGTDYPNKTLYHVVDEHRTLVYDHGGYDDRPPLFRVTVHFNEKGKDKTELDLTMTLPTPEAAAEARKFIKQAGGNATWDRLAEFLEKESTGHEKFVITRSFAAPIDVMYELWTDPQQIARWLPPAGFTMEFIRASIEPCQRTYWMMTNGTDVKFYGHCEYLQLAPPHSLTYTQQFADEHENVSRHPGLPVWPTTMLTKVSLTEEGAEQTRVTVTWEPYGATSPEELQAFIDARADMTQGWTGSFDKLESLLTHGVAVAHGPSR